MAYSYPRPRNATSATRPVRCRSSASACARETPVGRIASSAPSPGRSVRPPPASSSTPAAPGAAPTASADPAAAPQPGDDALLAIRPASVSLLRSAEEAPHLTGRVADVAFRGRGYEYAIDLPGLGRLTGVFARHRAERGDSVGLRLDPDGCHLFPAETKTEQEDTSAPAPALTV